MLTPAGAQAVVTAEGLDIAYVVAEENVPLIIAAPKVLAALERLFTDAGEHCIEEGCYLGETLEAARDVIAEAKGEG